jgi:TonB-linked SusC/RagA family outer membrane protein
VIINLIPKLDSMKKILMFFSLLLITGSFVMGQTVQISGTLTSSEDGLPIPGVSVTVKGTTLGAITGADGKYVISVPASAQTLMFSFIGFKTQEAAIAGKTTVNITLEQDIFRVDEVVVVAYGTQQKRDITGSVASVKGDAIKSVPVQSFDQALQGKAAGVAITIPNGVLNNPPVIRIRGVNSISASSYPLIVVDGVAMFTGDVSATNSASNALADINPTDIASMDILKDASATALYGSRAANGVIIITTKRGSIGKTRITYDGYVGWTEPYRLFDVMNAEQYLEHKNLAFANAGSTTVLVRALDTNGNPIATNWADKVYQKGFQQSHTLTISGATGNTNYFLSVGYTDQAGMIKKNYYTRKNARLNIDQRINKYLSFGANIAYTNGLSEAPNTGSLSGQAFSTAGAARLAFVLPPILGPYLNDGTYNINGSQIGSMGTGLPALGYYNPVAIMNLCKYTSETDRLLATLSGTLVPFKGLTLKSVYGIDNMSVESISYQSPITGDGYGPNGSATNSFSRPNRWTWTNTLNYDFTLLNKLNFGLLAGIEEQRTVSNNWSGNKTNISDPFFQTYQGSFVTAGMGGGSQGENFYISYFGRVNFNFDRKYYFELSVRRDGFSGLSAGNKFGNFGGVSVMWNASRESFIANSSLNKLFSDIRLKASYGKVGNMNGVGNYSSLFLYSAGVYGAAPILTYSQVGNPDLKWEASNKYDLGLSFGLLKDKFQVDLNYFYNDINDLILDVPQAPSQGVPGGSVPANVGSMYNTGIEFTLTSYNISKPKFSWTTTFNLSTLKNRVTELAPGVTELVGITAGLETTNRTFVGTPLGNIFAVTTHGVDPTTGRRIFVNSAGREVIYLHEATNKWLYLDDGSVSPAITLATDGKDQGSPLPKIYGGLDNTVSYLNFDFNLNITYALDFLLYNGSKAGLRDQRWWNNSLEVYNTSWKNPGDVTHIPKPIMNDNVSNGSSIPMTENIEKGNYAKVRTISLGYTFKKLPEITGIQSVRLYAQLFNAFVITKYTGSDPEVSSNGNSNLTPGIDRNSVPQARTYSFGLNVTF